MQAYQPLYNTTDTQIAGQAVTEKTILRSYTEIIESYTEIILSYIDNTETQCSVVHRVLSQWTSASTGVIT